MPLSTQLGLADETVATTAGSASGSVCTVTVGVAHGLSVGDIVTVAGCSPSAYNGTFRLSAVAATTVTYTAASAPGGAISSQGTISAYGLLGVVASRFLEYESESISTDTGRSEGNFMRPSMRVARNDRFVPYVMGASGGLVVQPLSKAFGFWLKHILGTVSTGTLTDSTYTHTGTVGSLAGVSFMAQVNRPLGNVNQVDQAVTWRGGKVREATIKMDREGLLTVELDLVFNQESTGVALASASYATSVEPFPWGLASLSINSVQVPVNSFEVKINNGLDDARMKLQNTTARREPSENTRRVITTSFETDFDDLASFYNRVRATTAANALLSNVVFTATAPTLAGATTFPTLSVTIPSVRVDEAQPNVAGPEVMTQAVSGVGLWTGSGSPITVAYTSVDATP
jgi:hypothetical protein